MDWLVMLAIIIAFLGGYYLGDKIATKETEARWSDAVAKAEYDRKYRNT